MRPTILYLKRKRVHESPYWGTQVLDGTQTDLIRATITGGGRFDARRPMRVSFEWVGCGKRIEGRELEQLMRLYPACEFQKDGYLPPRHRRTVDYLQPGTPIKVRFRGKASSEDTLDFRVFLSRGNFPNGK